jgi:putative ABC transport system permease protein
VTLFRMALRSLAQRPLGTALTAFSVALGVMLTSAIVAIEHQFKENYRNQGSGYPLVVGAKGSALQLVLNVVYHQDKSPGNIPFKVYRELEADNAVKLAVPYAVGDAFHGFRVVGTTDAIFNKTFGPLPDTPLRLKAGRPFRFDEHLLEHAIEEIETVAGAMKAASRGAGDGEEHCTHDHDLVMEAVCGSAVAQKLKLEVGARIEPTHGIEGGKEHEHEHLWTLVGILEPTGTALDRVVFINLDSFYGIPEHQAGGRIAETGDAGLSSVIVYPRGGVLKATLMGKLSKRSDLQVANPSEVIRQLLDMVGNVDRYFLLVALFVVAVGVLSVGVSLYNTMNERRREIAILRAIGARRSTIIRQLLLESAGIAVLGSLAGLLLGRLLVLAAGDWIAKDAGFTPNPWTWTPLEIGGRVFWAEPLLVLVVAAVSAIAGLLPALKGYRTDVASNLAPIS